MDDSEELTEKGERRIVMIKRNEKERKERERETKREREKERKETK